MRYVIITGVAVRPQCPSGGEPSRTSGERLTFADNAEHDDGQAGERGRGDGAVGQAAENLRC